MKLRIAAIGRLKGGPEAALVEDYQARIAAAARPLGLGPLEIVELEAAKAGDRAREGELLLKALPGGALPILLDERGENLPSRALAARLARWRDEGRPALCFWIAGPDGPAPELKAAAAQTLAFGPQTWPHKLVRVMLAEQIYRALTILSDHPYHRD